MSNLAIKSFAAKTQADALAKVATFANDAVKHGNGNFNLWMLAVAVAPLWNDVDAIGTALYTKYAETQNANPLCTRPIDIKTAGSNTLKNKAAQINAFANASRHFGAAKVFEFVEATIATLKATGGSFDAEKIKSHVAASFKAEKFLTQPEIKAAALKDIAAKAAKAKEAEAAKGKAKKPDYKAAVTSLRSTLKALSTSFGGQQGAVFAMTLAAFEERLTAKLKVVPAKGNGKAPVKAKTQVAPRLPAAIN